MEPTLTSALKKHGVLHHSELLDMGLSRARIQELAETERIEKLGVGFYSDPKIDPFAAALIGISRHYPFAVISNITALRFYGLSNEPIDRFDVDIPRGTNLKNRLLRVHRVVERKMIGISKLRLRGYPIRIYDKERTLCDAYREDPAGVLFFRALKRYVSGKDHDYSKLARYDETLGTEVMRHLRQELADE